MDDLSQNIFVRRLKGLLLVSSLVCIAFLLLAAFEENLKGTWRQHQALYRAALIERAGTEQARNAARSVRITQKQLFLPQLDRIDRCVTCHVGIDDPAQGSEGVLQPLRAHSGDTLEHHPVDKFGCTVCHDGQGRATDKEAAHGDVPHWPTPLLTGEAVYTTCGRCHHENDLYGSQRDLYARAGPLRPLDMAELEASVPGATNADQRAVGRGKKLVFESGCLGCHAFRGRGGTLGPDITHLGDKTAHDFDFSHVQGERTVKQWLLEHFKEPAQVVPGTLMPDMQLSDDEARDLTMYMLSLRRKHMPASHMPYPPRREGSPVSGATLFGMFCSACHGGSGQGSNVLDPDLMVLADPPPQLMTPALNNADTLGVASDDYLRHIIQRGRAGTNMIGWNLTEGGLNDSEIERLVQHIRAWEGPGPALDQISASRGDPRVGQALYRSRCRSCHGAQGEGGIGVALNSPSFLAIASDAFLAETVVEGRSNTAMPSWKQLSAQHVSDLIAFLRTWQRPAPPRAEVLARLASDAEPDAQHERFGQIIYRANCAACHGPNGDGGIGPSLNNDAFLAVVGDDYLYDALILGRPGTAMPSWHHLSVDDVVDLINHLRSWNDRRRQVLEPFNASGDWDRGKLVYDGACAGCHGLHAEGTIGTQLNNPVFLRSASDAMLRHWIHFGKPHTQMRAFAKGQQELVELTESQIEDLVSFLRRLESDRPMVTARPGIGIVAHGAELYASACASCHGPNGEGTTGSALSNPDFLRAASDGYLQATIALGRDGTEMRAMGAGSQGSVDLSAEDIQNIVALLRSWERHPPIEGIPPRFVIGADLEDGRQLYAGHCAGCHGPNGNDAWAPALNNADFLRAATDGFLQATIAFGRANTPMRSYGRGAGGVAELSIDQIDNIVAFIRTWAPPGHKPGPAPATEPPEHSKTLSDAGAAGRRIAHSD